MVLTSANERVATASEVGIEPDLHPYGQMVIDVQTFHVHQFARDAVGLNRRSGSHDRPTLFFVNQYKATANKVDSPA
jgi:hypothetical protein